MKLIVVLYGQVMTMNTLVAPVMATSGRRSAATTGRRRAALPPLPPTIPIGVNE